MKQNKQFSLISNWMPKIFAFIIAILIYFLMMYTTLEDRTVTIPLHVILPTTNTIVPESLVPDSIEIVISGYDDLVYLVDPDTITAYADFSKVTDVGIARIPVELVYDEAIFKEGSVVITAKPSLVRILFKVR